MKWNRFTLKTKTEAEDIVICTLARWELKVWKSRINSR